MQLKKFLKILLILPLISLGGCSLLQPKPIETTKFVYPNIIKANKPKPLQLIPLEFKVITDETYSGFRDSVISENGELVFIGLLMKNYENMSLNVGELIRYVEQQKAIILYYEKSLDRLKSDKEE
jgi:hypothetical protein